MVGEVLGGGQVVRHHHEGPVPRQRLGAEQRERARDEHHHAVLRQPGRHPPGDDQLVLELLGVPGGQRLLERRAGEQLGSAAHPAQDAAPLEHVEVPTHRLGRDAQLLADLGHAAAADPELEQQVGDRALALGGYIDQPPLPRSVARLALVAASSRTILAERRRQASRRRPAVPVLDPPRTVR